MMNLSQFQSAVKTKTGQTQASTTDLNIAINAAYNWVYSKLVDLYGANWFLTKVTFPITAGTQQYDLPADFFKVMRLENASGLAVEQLSMKQPGYFNVQQMLVGYPQAALGYLVYGYNSTTGRQQIYLVPSPAQSENWTLYYNYIPVDLAQPGDTPLMPATYQEAITLYAASQLYESSQNIPMAQYYYERAAGKLQEMINSSINRSASSNPKIEGTDNSQYWDGMAP